MWSQGLSISTKTNQLILDNTTTEEIPIKRRRGLVMPPILFNLYSKRIIQSVTRTLDRRHILSHRSYEAIYLIGPTDTNGVPERNLIADMIYIIELMKLNIVKTIFKAYLEYKKIQHLTLYLDQSWPLNIQSYIYDPVKKPLTLAFEWKFLGQHNNGRFKRRQF